MVTCVEYRIRSIENNIARRDIDIGHCNRVTVYCTWRKARGEVDADAVTGLLCIGLGAGRDHRRLEYRYGVSGSEY